MMGDRFGLGVGVANASAARRWSAWRRLFSRLS